MAIIIQSRNRVFLESHSDFTKPKTEPLSILENTVLVYSASGCIWFYNQTLDIDQVLPSLRKTLDAYPQWAGLLHFADFKPEAGHTHRQGHMQLSYGSPSNPGIECILANADFAMSSIIPTEIKTHWDATNIDYNSLLNDDTQLAPGEDQNLPAMKVQITNSTNASTAIAIGLAHPLADA